MANEGLWIGGLNVGTSKAIRARDLSGCLAIPERRGENIPSSGRNGDLRVARKKYTGRRAEFEFQMFGRTEAGVVPADPAAQMYVNLRALGQALSQDLMTMVHQLPDGSLREIPVEVAVALKPERSLYGDYLTVGISFDSASAFWRSAGAVSAPFSITNTSTRLMTEFALSDAPIDDPVVTIGPSSNPVLTDVVSGTFLSYQAVIAAGQALTVNCETGQLTGTGGLVPDRTKLRTHPEDGRWLALSPAVGAAPTLRFTQTGGSAAVPITVLAKQSWLFG